jgi:hypothetical protein
MALAGLIHNWDESNPADIAFIEKISGIDYCSWLRLVESYLPQSYVRKIYYNSDLRDHYPDLSNLFLDAVRSEFNKISETNLSPHLLSGLTYGILLLSVNKLHVNNAVSDALTDANWQYWAENNVNSQYWAAENDALFCLCEAAQDVFWAKFMDAYKRGIIQALYTEKKITSDNMIPRSLALLSDNEAYLHKVADILFEMAAIEDDTLALYAISRIMQGCSRSDMQQLVEDSFKKGYAPQIYKFIFYSDYRTNFKGPEFVPHRRTTTHRDDYEDQQIDMHYTALAFLKGFRDWKFKDLEEDILNHEHIKAWRRSY